MFILYRESGLIIIWENMVYMYKANYFSVCTTVSAVTVNVCFEHRPSFRITDAHCKYKIFADEIVLWDVTE